MAENHIPGDSDDMARLTEEQRIFAVEEMVKTKSLTGTKKELKTKFGIEVTRPTIERLYRKWRNHGTVKNLSKGNAGGHKSARTEEKNR